MMTIISKIRDWYGKYERPVSSLSLIGGFIFDAVALKRVDQFWENVWVVGHIVIVAICMIYIHKVESNPGDEADPERLHFWLVNIVQFFFGGLISVFLVFYFRSGDLFVSWPFILLLALVFWANESLKRRFVRLSFQVALLFLSIFLCAIFLVPVILHSIGTWVFLLSGIISLGSIYLFLQAISKVNKAKFEQSREMITILISTIFVGMNILYFTNIIPPIPLSLKDSGAFHSIEKDKNGNYLVQYEPSKWRDFFSVYDDFHLAPNEEIYAYSAVFSPTSLNTIIIHKWQYYNAEKQRWEDKRLVYLTLLGGREGGFRTYSQGSNLESGSWHVSVETLRGQVIGRIRFNIVYSDTKPKTIKKVLD